MLEDLHRVPHDIRPVEMRGIQVQPDRVVS
jgi:hypothetical protein